MSNIHVRKIDPHLLKQLKQAANDQQLSVNTLILNLLKRGLGLSDERTRPVYHDLDQYAGTWTKQQAASFLNEMSHFERIDEDLWK